MRNVIFILFFIPFIVVPQEKGSIGVEFNSSYDLVTIPKFESSMDRRFIKLPDYIAIISRQKITHGFSYGFNVNYQISKLFSIGMYSKYLISQSESEFRRINDNAFINLPADTIFGFYNHKITNTIIGINTAFDFNNLKFWMNTNWLSRIESKLDIGLGYSFAEFYSFTYSNNYENGVLGELNKTSGIHLKGNIKFGYRLIKSPVFSSLGLFFGYQCLMTKPLQTGESSTFKEYAPRLNFAGLTTGIYLTFGK